MASRQTRSKSSHPKQHRTLRPRQTKNEVEKPKQNALKSEKLRKGKRKCEFGDTVDGPRLDMVGKMSKLIAPLSSKNDTNDLMMEGVESTDGGPLDFYPMDKRGRLYIIHNFAFNGGHAFREGSCHDVGNLTTCFQALGFIDNQRNDCKSNLTCQEMKSCCEIWASQKHHDVDCIVLAILTHGSYPDLLQGSDGNYIAVDELLSPFARFNRTLVGKPKIFFIEACRGDKPNIGVQDRATTSGISTQRNFRSRVVSSSFQAYEEAGLFTNSGLLPPQADHLIAFATGVGYPAYRNRMKGSFYIEELTKTLREEYSRKHLTDIITKVQGRVSNQVRGEDGIEKYEVQMPEFVSRLRGPIYLA